MENMGRPDGRHPPIDLSHLYRDPESPLVVELLINRAHPDQRGQHWALSWTVGDLPPRHKVQRILHIVREVGYYHYTNWGPLTRTFDPLELEAISIAQLTRAQRGALEAIAGRTEVCVPNGEWNCQNWVMEVLECAVADGLVSAAERDAALDAAKA
ncbi:hypothetical protein MVEN_02295700 [Mycena venus]|uniref:Uncharacterized protein n=1 Tax=Mycena venus TaxID=2733690 RepID=A0A8H6X544_9AGAR|nr:hypothetical protein MVEN_02295700 [Mycena venus]